MKGYLHSHPTGKLTYTHPFMCKSQFCTTGWSSLLIRFPFFPSSSLFSLSIFFHEWQSAPLTTPLNMSVKGYYYMTILIISIISQDPMVLEKVKILNFVVF